MGTSFQNGARSKNVDKKLGRERRRVVLKSDLAVVATGIITCAFKDHHQLWIFGFTDHSKDKEIIFFESYVTSANRGML